MQLQTALPIYGVKSKLSSIIVKLENNVILKRTTQCVNRQMWEVTVEVSTSCSRNNASAALFLMVFSFVVTQQIIVQGDPAVISNTSNLINMMHNLTVKFIELRKSASLSVSKFNFSSINSLLLQLEASFLDLAPLSKRF